MTYNDGGPAFPLAGAIAPNGEIEWRQPGMTLRDWFAAQALNALAPEFHQQNICDSLLTASPPLTRVFAERCYDIADAMLAARERKATP